MKQIDNRQKQQILMRAQKTFLGGKNPLLPRDKEKEMAHAHTDKPADKDSKTEKVEPLPAAEATVHRTEPKVGRNDLCPCGSGKKYKKCCLK